MPGSSVLVVDNYDSFTFTLVDYLTTLGARVRVERNDAISIDDALDAEHSAILISPGPGSPEEAGISVPLAAACIAARRPLLGVCLGHQAIAIACGSEVARVPPIHGKVATVRHDRTGLFAGLQSPMAATRYHSLAVPNPQLPLFANAWSDDKLVMAFRHASAPVHGVQFHPESIASQHGHALLRAFLALTHENA
ncbi:MAG TPA: aminodeoxychorismate/anthranilate synthase component II [Sphingomicrobium sp.]|jgi:anthranilate synthase component II|nr:aminodeoxychorismate/anthranilate synthase component II [Sphingomicrobium sp.]